MSNLAMAHQPAPEPEDSAAQPQVFMRTFATPTGLPWDQHRAAQLEARHGAPLPIVDLMYSLKRLEGWGPGRPGRFAVFYLRRRDFTQPFETTMQVDGQAVRVAFGGRAGRPVQLARMRTAVLALVVAGAFAGAAAAVTSMVLDLRSTASNQLAAAEREAAGKLRLAQRAASERADADAFSQVASGAGAPDQVLADLVWLSEAKAPDARIVAVHWDHGLMAIEARGSAAPIVAVDRRVARAPHAIRPGVSLWGVGRAEAAPGGGKSDAAP